MSRNCSTWFISLLRSFSTCYLGILSPEYPDYYVGTFRYSALVRTRNDRARATILLTTSKLLARLGWVIILLVHWTNQLYPSIILWTEGSIYYPQRLVSVNWNWEVAGRRCAFTYYLLVLHPDLTDGKGQNVSYKISHYISFSSNRVSVKECSAASRVCYYPCQPALCHQHPYSYEIIEAY